MAWHFYLILAVITIIVATTSFSYAQECNGVLLSYAYNTGERLQPTVSDAAKQPYRFESTVTLLNNGIDEVKSWKVFVGFKHNEILVSASGAVLDDGSTLPAAVGNGTVFSGYPQADLKTAVETAGDLTQTQVQIDLVGTVFGVAPPDVPLPSTIKLANDGFKCVKTNGEGDGGTNMCCMKDPKSKTNVTTNDKFMQRQNGDLTIMYDVIRTYDSSYWAEVTITNHNLLGRLDNWKLSWDWMNDEFINAMKGAYPSVVDVTDCVFGKRATHYTDLDFSNVLNCQRRPTIIDMPPTKFNDTQLGKIPFCCRNGTILPPSMDLSKSVSRFQMEVYKMPPNLNRSALSPPQNWQINGTLNPTYKCGPPVRVSPTQNPDPSGIPSNKTVMASWQVVCNITKAKGSASKCCVSFSAYYNESAIPCNTCACGCPINKGGTCSATKPAMWLPPDALLVPFENRSAKALAWADLKHLPKPNPMPCGDNCGVSINWHLNTDYAKGWSARVTLFNWGDINFADWFAAVQMDKAAPGFEKMYSFNATTLNGINNTIFMQGLPGLNYLVAEVDGSNPLKDPRVPGKQQSVISFTKKLTPGINVAHGDGFPKKVFFNGEECSLPSVIPSSGSRKVFSWVTLMLLTLVLIILKQQ